jgi:hypothetical protein
MGMIRPEAAHGARLTPPPMALGKIAEAGRPTEDPYVRAAGPAPSLAL